jgi:sugar phosphate isomerase/epimerase
MIGVSCPDFCSVDFEEMRYKISKHFSHWEIFSEAEHAVQRISERFLDEGHPYDMTYSIHTTISDMNIAAVNERLREASVLEILSEMESANNMGISIMTVHPGLYSFAVDNIKDRSIEAARLSLRVLGRAMDEYGVVLAVENMPSFPLMLGQTAKELEYLIEGTDLKVCFDIGHANTTGQTKEMVDVFRGRIANVHIHDNMGDRDAHLTLGAGNIDFKHVISMLSYYDGNFIIESKGLESAIESKVILEKILYRGLV